VLGSVDDPPHPGSGVTGAPGAGDMNCTQVLDFPTRRCHDVLTGLMIHSQNDDIKRQMEVCDDVSAVEKPSRSCVPRCEVTVKAAHLAKASVGLALLALVASACGSSAPSAAKGPITITYETNEVLGGKNAAGAEYDVNTLIPDFEKMEKAQGKNVTVKFVGSGVAGTDYADALALDLKSGGGPDVFALDGPYYGEFAESGYIKPLSKVVGASYKSWSGWAQIPKSVQTITEFDGKQYGIPTGTDGRVLYYNKQLFREADIPVPWQPTSWADIIAVGKKLKAKDPGIEPLQFDAGVAMGEATTLQGWLPMLAGAGQLIYNESTGKWQGNTPAMQAVANFYHTIYTTGLANGPLQIGTNGRDETFQLLSEGKIGVYSESTYVWESVISPASGSLYPMANRDAVIGYCLIPAETPGKGIRGQSFVSMSGGAGNTINPHTKHPKTAWAFLTFMNSKSQSLKSESSKPGLSPRQDVNAIALQDHPLLRFVADKVLPITAYRPSLTVYPQVSVAIRTLAQNLATGMPVSTALTTYTNSLDAAVGKAHVTNS